MLSSLSRLLFEKQIDATMSRNAQNSIIFCDLQRLSRKSQDRYAQSPADGDYFYRGMHRIQSPFVICKDQVGNLKSDMLNDLQQTVILFIEECTEFNHLL